MHSKGNFTYIIMQSVGISLIHSRLVPSTRTSVPCDTLCSSPACAQPSSHNQSPTFGESTPPARSFAASACRATVDTSGVGRLLLALEGWKILVRANLRGFFLLPRAQACRKPTRPCPGGLEAVPGVPWRGVQRVPPRIPG